MALNDETAERQRTASLISKQIAARTKHEKDQNGLSLVLYELVQNLQKNNCIIDLHKNVRQ